MIDDCKKIHTLPAFQTFSWEVSYILRMPLPGKCCLGKTSNIIYGYPSFLPVSLRVDCWEGHHMLLKYPFGQFEHLSQLSPHNLLPFLSLFALKAEWGEGFDAVLELFSNSQNMVCYQCCFKHTWKTQHHMGCYKGSELPPRQTLYKRGEYQFLLRYKLLSGKNSSGKILQVHPIK